MNRRGFLGALLASPAVPYVPAEPKAVIGSFAEIVPKGGGKIVQAIDFYGDEVSVFSMPIVGWMDR